MNFQKLILMLLMSVVLGQSVLASADMHLVFEETDTHHQHDNAGDVNLAEEDHSGDDCGHCCHSHGCGIYILSDAQIQFNETSDTHVLMDDGSDYFYSPDPSLRPPIA